MTERRWKWIDEDTGKPLCTVSVPNVSPEDRPQSEPCGALIVEGPCRNTLTWGTKPGFQCRGYRHADGSCSGSDLLDAQPYDGWECESGHSVAAEVVA